VRCLYVDLDGTLLGPGGAITRDGDGAFTLLGLRALEACHRADVHVVAMSGRRRSTMVDDTQLLGLADFVFEAGGGFVLDGEVHWLAEPNAHDRTEASGAPKLLLDHYRGRLERYEPYDDGREVSHLLRGLIDLDEAQALLNDHGHDDLRLIDNGASHHHPGRLAVLPDVRVYHLVPRAVSKAAAVAAHARARGFAQAECVAVGDSREDLDVAEVVGALWLVANAVEREPELRAALARHPNARLTEAAHGPGVYEAVVTTLAERR
jgi:hydroxymethylpyrimidine pyrophosphatase-like HAD family hydrolase